MEVKAGKLDFRKHTDYFKEFTETNKFLMCPLLVWYCQMYGLINYSVTLKAKQNKIWVNIKIVTAIKVLKNQVFRTIYNNPNL